VSPLSLVQVPVRLAADGLEELQGAAAVGVLALAGRLEDQACAALAVIERLDTVVGTVAGWTRVRPWK
jgi:hypothetical protein